MVSVCEQNVCHFVVTQRFFLGTTFCGNGFRLWAECLSLYQLHQILPRDYIFGMVSVCEQNVSLCQGQNILTREYIFGGWFPSVNTILSLVRLGIVSVCEQVFVSHSTFFPKDHIFGDGFRQGASICQSHSIGYMYTCLSYTFWTRDCLISYHSGFRLCASIYVTLAKIILFRYT